MACFTESKATSYRTAWTQKLERVPKFNVEKIKPQDLGGAAGPPDEET
jgi:hypothetical protein